MTGARIVTFLGLGNPEKWPDTNYEPCDYELDGIRVGRRTAIHDAVTVKVAQPPVVVVVLGTATVRDRWFDPDRGGLYGKLLAEALDGDVEPPSIDFVELPDGKSDSERWEIFKRVVGALQPEPRELVRPVGNAARVEPAPPSEIYLDITHGFRSQPFFAASAVAFVRSQQRRHPHRRDTPAPSLRLLYAAYEVRDREKMVAPVWDLTQFLDVLEWVGSIDDLMSHGRADRLRDLLGGLQKSVIEQGNTPPKLKNFGNAAAEFADALVTARVPALLTRHATKLHGALRACRQDVEQHVPVLPTLLDELDGWVAAITADRPISTAGIRAQLRLADIYLELQRYTELAALLREILVSAFTLERVGEGEAVQPGPSGQGFQKQREQMEAELGDLTRAQTSQNALVELYRNIGNLRNDVEHAGHSEGPREPRQIRRQLVSGLEAVKRLFEGQV